MKNSSKPILFSGIQPSGKLHIGNYIGAISQWLDLQDDYRCIFCVVDYHAITVKQNPADLRQSIIDIAKTYLASGIDPQKAIIFKQSDISEHTELGWILNTITKVGELNKMTQFKDKSGIRNIRVSDNYLVSDKINNLTKNIEEAIIDIMNENVHFDRNKVYERLMTVKKYLPEVTTDYEHYEHFLEGLHDVLNNKLYAGILNYPTLMAADILLYGTDVVPVGDDQNQHVEITRTLGRRFNAQFGETFKIPQALVRKEGARIMALDEPEKKMSKSAKSPANYISLLDDPLIAHKKIKRAVTDSGSDIHFDADKKPAISNLLTIYSVFSNKSVKELEVLYEGKTYGEFKEDLANVVANFLEDFQERYNAFSDDDVRKIMNDGAALVKPMAEATMRNVKKNLGIN